MSEAPYEVEKIDAGLHWRIRCNGAIVTNLDPFGSASVAAAVAVELNRAFRKGQRDAQAEVRRAIGLTAWGDEVKVLR